MISSNNKYLGVVLWKGKSLLDGERIMLIATGVFGGSKNRKTGEMIQTFVLRRDVPPMLARRLGMDYSICGNCMHREQSTCYVNLCHGPINIYNAYHDDRYKTFEENDIEYFKDRNIRFGSYGDLAAVPYEVWEKFSKVSKTFTGYTHQWKTCDQRLKNICMASVDSIKNYNTEYKEAQKMGWRTFRVRECLENQLEENEIICPASEEGGKKTTCENCGLCSGISKPCKSISIVLHGDSDALGNWRKKRYIEIMKARKNKQQWRRDYKEENIRFKEVCPF